MKNLIITPAVGLHIEDVHFFIKSLRRFYQDDVYFLIGKKDIILKKKLSEHDCKFIEVNVHKYDIQLKRYKFFLNILENNINKYNKVLFCDCRDIYFQSNPFDFNYKGSINFFSEDIIFSECEINSQWLKNTFGIKIFEELKSKQVCCGGTVLGESSEMVKWLKLMIELIKKYPFKKRFKYLITFRRDKNGRGCDQAHGNYIAYKNFFKQSHLYSNHDGPIATAMYLKKIKFDSKSQLINGLNKPYVIVHQYDKRWSEFSDQVNFLKKNYN